MNTITATTRQMDLGIQVILHTGLGDIPFRYFDGLSDYPTLGSFIDAQIRMVANALVAEVRATSDLGFKAESFLDCLGYHYAGFGRVDSHESAEHGGFMVRDEADMIAAAVRRGFVAL
jgi:hypothetical protein